MPVHIIDKPLGISSHDAVARARKLLKTRRVGHAGTLDPLATGVLVLLSEDATKLSPFLTGSEKHYLAWVSFGASTPTLDAEGPISEVTDASHLREEDVGQVLPAFLELREQLPPKYSAIKQAGVKGYEAARKGQALELPVRPARYHEITLLALAKTRDALPARFSANPEGHWQPHARGQVVPLPEALGDFPTALLFLKVQAGTYIRAFARDLGEALGAGAHLSGLVRTRAGRCGLEHALPLAAIADHPGLALHEAVPYPLITLSDEDTERVRHGQPPHAAVPERSGLTDPSGKLVAIAEPQGPRVKLLRVWSAQH